MCSLDSHGSTYLKNKFLNIFTISLIVILQETYADVSIPENFIPPQRVVISTLSSKHDHIVRSGSVTVINSKTIEIDSE